MLLGRVPSSPIKCVQLFGLQRCLSHSEASPRWHSEFISHFLKPSAHRTSFKTRFCRSPLTVSDMQTDSFSCGRKSPAVVRDEMDGGGETEGREVKEVPDQLETIGMELQQAEGVIGQSTASVSFLNVKSAWVFFSPVSSSESTQEKRKRKIRDGGRRVDREEDAKKKKKQSQRPNYFISIPITNTQISSAVFSVQELLLQHDPRLAKAMIPIPTLHITLLVTHLATQEEVDLAASVLAQVEPSLVELLGGRDLVLPFSGISHFRKEVVFVGLAPGQHRHTLDTVAELLQSHFEEQGLLQRGTRGFEPHLTIMKLSRASNLRSQGVRRVDPALYSNYTNKFFGDQTVERLDLCSMLKKKQPDGYYYTETSLQLG
ncbi:A-kinase anchor protein 7 isoform gamma [Takifugu flavidus]|uniref:A-kinase anchor protein 7 isoform gamma n=1 Tax=Takifugu flavidus TaxID=433684 RepID=A0A5C6NPL5_9TELE|nr:A-kinase anchor protein 7 isoform gamma [Takifugu flavidus]